VFKMLRESGIEITFHTCIRDFLVSNVDRVSEYPE
jgi:hypothetical protein